MKYKNIQGLRALAVNAVVLCHILADEQKHSYGPVILSDLAHVGALGVDLFFVISGFIVATVAASDRWGVFLFRRATRIYPPYWFYTTALLIAALVAPGIVNNPVAHDPLLVLKSYLLLPDQASPVLAVGWTLVYELYFYVVFAVFIALGWRQHWGFIAWAAALGLVCSMVATDVIQPINIITSPMGFEFIGGGLVAYLIQHDKLKGLTALLLPCGIFVLTMNIFYHADVVEDLSAYRVLLFGIPCIMIVYGATILELHYKYITPFWIVLIGDASYSIYLSHAPIVSAAWHIQAALRQHTASLHAPIIALLFVVTNVFGILSFFYIEKPLSRLFRTKAPLLATGETNEQFPTKQ